MSAADRPRYIEARKIVLGAVETIERITRPDGIPFGEHVPRQAARALRSAAELLDPVVARRFGSLEVRENPYVPDGEVWVSPTRVLPTAEAVNRYAGSAGRARDGEPYPACCYPEAAVAVEIKHVEFSGSMSREEVDRLLEREADEGRAERSHAEGI